jgi:peptide-methionine (S)-S-oxide reductase
MSDTMTKIKQEVRQLDARQLFRIGTAFAIAGIALVLGSPSVGGESGESSDMKTEKIVLGGGCFWCVEAVYEKVPGIKSVISGYAGGATKNPTYEQVSTGRTGHAEVVLIEFDPAIVSRDRIYELFWKAHDPTTLNRQGADVGTQYRSIILYADEAQKAAAEASKKAAQTSFKAPIVTEIAPLETFYPAEEDHQDYYKRNPNAGYNVMVIRPKLEKLKKAGEIPKE